MAILAGIDYGGKGGEMEHEGGKRDLVGRTLLAKTREYAGQATPRLAVFLAAGEYDTIVQSSNFNVVAI